MNKRIYLAAPYTDPSQTVREHRFSCVSQVAAAMMGKGHLVYSPVTHGHTLGMFGKLPPEFTFWESHCLSFLRHWAEELHVLTIAGWEKSLGVRAEIAEAEALGIKIRYLSGRYV